MLGFKISKFLTSAYPGLFENFPIFIPRWPEARDNAENILLGFYLNTLLKHNFITRHGGRRISMTYDVT